MHARFSQQKGQVRRLLRTVQRGCRHLRPESEVEWPLPDLNVPEIPSFVSHLYIKMIFLPRQARDKHREGTQQETIGKQHSSDIAMRPQCATHLEL
eukprot:COSAG06_NODE_895_length_11669_cov_5.131384_7_plen_96_part_00